MSSAGSSRQRQLPALRPILKASPALPEKSFSVSSPSGGPDAIYRSLFGVSGVRIETQVMTADQVRELIRVQSADNLRTTNDHRIGLEQTLVTPQRISVIARQVAYGRLKDQTLNVWRVGRSTRAMDTRSLCVTTVCSLASRPVASRTTKILSWPDGTVVSYRHF